MREQAKVFHAYANVVRNRTDFKSFDGSNGFDGTCSRVCVAKKEINRTDSLVLHGGME